MNNNTYVFELLVLFAEVVVEVEKLLVGKLLLKVTVARTLQYESLLAVGKTNPAHLNY